MSSVAIHPPKTPVTKGSSGVAKATLPNVCKMPGPPAPFVPAPLPNIAKSGSSPEGYSKTVKIEGDTVAIRGAMFESMGDMASKGTGGGLISANCHGPAKFITPGSLTVKIEGKSVHLLGEPMLNNCGSSGSPPNTGATMMGLKQGDRVISDAEKALQDIVCDCHRNTPPSGMGCKFDGVLKHECCEECIKNHVPPPEIGGERGYLKKKKGQVGRTPAKPRASYPGKPPSGSSFPDACAMSGGQPTQFFDFKFPCGGDSDGAFFMKDGRGKSQFDKYLELSEDLGMTERPECITARGCPP